MTTLQNILSGWKSYLVSDPVSEVKAKERAEICALCPEIKKGSFEQLMPDHSLKTIQGMKCGECECPLSTATRSKDYNCPLNKW